MSIIEVVYTIIVLLMIVACFRGHRSDSSQSRMRRQDVDEAGRDLHYDDFDGGD